MNHLPGLFLMLFMLACNDTNESVVLPEEPYLLVLGIAQDAGYPQADCHKECCQMVWEGKQKGKMVSCLALIDPQHDRGWIFDATPDFREQLHLFQQHASELAGVFVTHAHVGHYTGLMHLGREVMGASSVPVYAMPRMNEFLRTNGPWSQLVSLNNINLHSLQADSVVQLTRSIDITPFLVPHRDEYSETVGFQIKVNDKSAIFIPDIDKWEKWDRDINAVIQANDAAFVDGTFFQDGELPGRNMHEIPHPFVAESMALFADLPEAEKDKVHFIHFNHTNPLLLEGSTAQRAVVEAGFHVAKEGGILTLE